MMQTSELWSFLTMFVSWWTYAAVQLFYGDGESTWIIPSYIPDQGEDFPRLYHHQKEVPYMYYLDDQDVPRYRAHYHRLRPQFQSPRRIYQDLPPPYTETRYKAPGVAAATHYRPSVCLPFAVPCLTTVVPSFQKIASSRSFLRLPE
jgi:hypothetical protein